MGHDTQAVADALRSLEAAEIRRQRCAALAYSLLMLRTAVQLDQKGGAAC